MNEIVTPTANSVTATQAALKRIAEIINKDEQYNALRISVEGGGCSGFSYKFDLVNEQNDDDFIIEAETGKILVDEMSMIYMNGSQIDFVDNLLGQSFQINNPNAVASCGCGTSFAL